MGYLSNSELIEMYRKKKAFINHLSKAFENVPTESTVVSIDYELYKKETDTGDIKYLEYLVVTFVGGAKSVVIANGNSATANFRVLGKLLNGGYYDECESYNRLGEFGYVLVEL